MGKRSRTDSVIKVMGAFFARKTWTQADLARTVDLGTEALRNVLREMQELGIDAEAPLKLRVECSRLASTSRS